MGHYYQVDQANQVNQVDQAIENIVFVYKMSNINCDVLIIVRCA
jgi:hypothetical protein